MSERANSRQALPGVWTLARDVLTFAGGWVLTFMEVSRPEIRDSVLVFCGTMITTPGLFVGGAAVVASINRRRDGTPEPPSSPQPEAASSSQ